MAGGRSMGALTARAVRDGGRDYRDRRALRGRGAGHCPDNAPR